MKNIFIFFCLAATCLNTSSYKYLDKAKTWIFLSDVDKEAKTYKEEFLDSLDGSRIIEAVIPDYEQVSKTCLENRVRFRLKKQVTPEPEDQWIDNSKYSLEEECWLESFGGKHFKHKNQYYRNGPIQHFFYNQKQFDHFKKLKRINYYKSGQEKGMTVYSTIEKLDYLIIEAGKATFGSGYPLVSIKTENEGEHNINYIIRLIDIVLLQEDKPIKNKYYSDKCCFNQCKHIEKKNQCICHKQEETPICCIKHCLTIPLDIPLEFKLQYNYSEYFKHVWITIIGSYPGNTDNPDFKLKFHAVPNDKKDSYNFKKVIMDDIPLGFVSEQIEVLIDNGLTYQNLLDIGAEVMKDNNSPPNQNLLLPNLKTIIDKYRNNESWGLWKNNCFTFADRFFNVISDYIGSETKANHEQERLNYLNKLEEAKKENNPSAIWSRPDYIISKVYKDFPKPEEIKEQEDLLANFESLRIDENKVLQKTTKNKKEIQIDTNEPRSKKRKFKRKALRMKTHRAN